MINNVLMCPPRRMQMRKCADVFKMAMLVHDNETALLHLPLECIHALANQHIKNSQFEP